MPIRNAVRRRNIVKTYARNIGIASSGVNAANVQNCCIQLAQHCLLDGRAVEKLPFGPIHPARCIPLFAAVFPGWAGHRPAERSNAGAKVCKLLNTSIPCRVHETVLFVP